MKLLSNYRKMAIVIISIMLLIIGFSNESTAQKLQLVIGKYDCTTNGDCGSDQFCDIDAHRCIRYTDKAECPTSPGLEGEGDTDCTDKIKPEDCPASGFCPIPEECSDCSDLIKPEECPVKTINCALGQYNFNNKCVECVHNDNCPSDRPLCRDNQCVSCGAEHWNNYACVTCSGAKPKWDASSLTCVECLSNNDCDHVCDQSTKTCHLCMYMDIEKPYYNAKTNSCEVCPKEKPIWYVKEKECKKCFTNIECEKFDISTPSCHSDGKCYACDSGTYWNTTLKNCVECLYEDHCTSKLKTSHCRISQGICVNCTGTTPIWDGSSTCVKCTSDAQCAALGTEAQMCDVSTGSCVKGVTITWNNMGTITTQRLIAGKSITASTPSWNDFVFSHWSSSVGGNAVTFPVVANKDMTFYAYYKEKSEETDEFPLNACGGSRLGSESTDTTKTITKEDYNGKVEWNFKVYFKSAWNNDGYNCSVKSGQIGWKIDNVAGSGSPTQTHCSWIDAGSGKELTFYFERSWDWTKYCDVVWRGKALATSKIIYPY